MFQRVQKSLGGRVRVVVTGSAPISEKVITFLRCAIGCHVSHDRPRNWRLIILTHTMISYPLPFIPFTPLTPPPFELLFSLLSPSRHPSTPFPSPQVLEGYGQTECGAAATMTTPGDMSVGHVGVPLPCNDIKLVDVSDMNYFAANNEGEVGCRVGHTHLITVWVSRSVSRATMCLVAT